MSGYSISKDGLSITCFSCGSTSYHPGDIEHRYCGYCHKYHSLGRALFFTDKNEKNLKRENE